MKHLKAAALGAMAVCLATASLLAHDITYKGTVISTAKTSVRVNVVDEKTKKTAPMTFEFDKETKILRGDTVVTVEQARIQKGEKIAVTIDHDLDETLAIVIRLDAKK